MENNRNNNLTDLFGDSAQTNRTPNRPLDISSDLWTPISTGVPMQGTQPSLLQDAQSTATPKRAPDAQPISEPKRTAAKKQTAKKQAAKKQTAKKQAAKKRAAKKRAAQKQKAAAEKQNAPAPQRQRPLVASRAEELLQRGQKAKQRHDDHKQKLQRRKADERYARERMDGQSPDDLRKKTKQNKQRKRKIRAVVTVAAILGVALLSALVYCVAYGAPIAEIVVTGESPYSAEEIITASGIMTGENMFRIHTRSLNKRLCRALPYLGSVRVDYQLPDVLALEVEGTTEKYLISGKAGYLCVDENGKILSLKKKKLAAGQYRLDGFDTVEGTTGEHYAPEETDAERFALAKEIIAELEQNGLQKANILDLTNTEDIIVRYDGRVNIYLGTTKNLSIRMKAAAQTILEHLNENSIAYLEISHEGKIFLNEGVMTKD